MDSRNEIESAVREAKKNLGEAADFRVADALAILEGMAWLGLEYDEGPFYQTHRFDRYNQVIDELLAKGLAIFYVTAGNVKDTIIGGVNFGRDTDCVTAVATGFSGTLSGTATIPGRWIEQVDAAEKAAQHTVSHLSCRETTEGLYAAALAEMDKMKRIAAMIDESIKA